jgi:hypothetical protein
MLFYLGLGAWVNGEGGAAQPQIGADQKETGSTMIAMPGTKRAMFAGIAVAMLCGLMAGRRHRSMACKQRGIALNSQVDALKRAATDKLKIGKKKQDVIGFFAENKFPISFDRSFATGTIYTLGCSPNGCGTDEFLIVLKVKLDDSGSVQSEPVIGGGYTNCL